MNALWLYVTTIQYDMMPAAATGGQLLVSVLAIERHQLLLIPPFCRHLREYTYETIHAYIVARPSHALLLLLLVWHGMAWQKVQHSWGSTFLPAPAATRGGCHCIYVCAYILSRFAMMIHWALYCSTSTSSTITTTTTTTTMFSHACYLVLVFSDAIWLSLTFIYILRNAYRTQLATQPAWVSRVIVSFYLLRRYRHRHKY